MKSILILLINFMILSAGESFANYKVKHTILGNIAHVDVSKTVEGSRYIATLSITTVGLASSVSEHLKKYFISQGSVKEGRFYPDVLTVMKDTDSEKQFITYRFDHKNKILHVDKCLESLIVERHFNPISFSFDETEYLEFTHESHQAKNYVRDDVISLFFNAKAYMQNVKSLESSNFMAAGIYDKDEDAIDGILAFGISEKDIRDIIDTSIADSMLSVALSEKVFHDSDKWLYIDVHSDSLPQRVKLNDIAFGDILIDRVFKNVALKE